MKVERMKSRPIGGSGVLVSTVGLGGFELGPEPGEEPDVARAIRVIETALAEGVNWLDTSENYLDTRNESLIGATLERIGGELLVATKVAPSAGVTGGGSGFRRDEVHAACRASLRRLGREQIDIYFLHWPDDTGVPLEETWGAMSELANAGLVRAIGLSNYELEEIERCHAQRPVDAVQTGLSMIDYLDDRSLIARCGQLGIGVVIYEPLASGILSDKTLAQVLALWDGPWVESDFFERLLAPGKAERSFAVAPHRDAARRNGRPACNRVGAAPARRHRRPCRQSRWPPCL
jgi:aryl-alcohol dehydrogenase-like predicted oxidoreductase